MTVEEALLTLGNSTGEVVLGVLSMLCGDGAEKGPASMVASGAAPLEAIAYPAVAANVSYVDGVTGGNVFTMSRLGARRLAAAMMMQELPTEDSGSELDELELSALGEAMNQMMAAAAAALAGELGYEVEISVPETRVLVSAAETEGLYPQTPHATSVSFTVLGEPCRLLQFVPNAFVVRMTRALADRASEYDTTGHEHNPEEGHAKLPVRDIRVRVAAELGRASLPLGKAVGLGPNAVIELDREADDPIDLYVNGRRFATGELLLIDQSEWAIRIERVLDVNPTALTSNEGGS
jgi:flagellar motor switch protein FliN/FliY